MAKIYSCSYFGLSGQIIEVEADISNGLSSFSIVGLGDASVQEARDRVRAGIKNSGFSYPATRKTINLAPAQIKKQGSLFDLPIAVSLLSESGQIRVENLKKSVLVGELSLKGEVKKIRGSLLIAQTAKLAGFENLLLPHENALEASFIEGITIFPVKCLKDVVDHCSGNTIKPFTRSQIVSTNTSSPSTKLMEILGLAKAKRALEICMAGGHNLLLFGSPGCGKTVLARASKSILPKMINTEILESTILFSIAGLLDDSTHLITERPFREVHHTASVASVIGGGKTPKPGEISLAHNGILFLDELAEFPRSLLEALRQPLEDKYITINRANFSVKFPCDFMLIGTMNPCPCGYKNDKKIDCKCSDNQILNYQKRLSGPLLDRFDIFIHVEKVSMGKIFSAEAKASTVNIMNKIETARNIQLKRYRGTNLIKNSEMTLKEIKKHCILTKECEDILNQAETTLNLSNRGYIKCLKLARTIADMEETSTIGVSHLAEALQYRNRQ